MGKNEQHKVVLFCVAAAFAGLARAAGLSGSPSDVLDDAEAFMKEAEKRGINMGELLAGE